MGRKVHHFHSVTRAQRAATRAQATLSRHGPSVVYVGGRPIVLQEVSARTGIPLETLSARVRAARVRGAALTVEALESPVRRRVAPR